ncbi:MAG: PDZ domain-containing protein, partial [Acidobacteriota bacterium]
LGAGLVLESTPSGTQFLHVEKLAPDGPAAKAGLRVWDEVIAIDGKTVAFKNDLAFIDFTLGLVPGNLLRMSVVRGAKHLEILILLERFPPARLGAWRTMYEVARRSSMQKPKLVQK